MDIFVFDFKLSYNVWTVRKLTPTKSFGAALMAVNKPNMAVEL